MIKKFNKKKGSRQGAILVTVVFILAFAIIFIAAAMAMTQATRRRIYGEAESDQARLTVTSVAEAFYRAIQKCEFDDDTIITLAKGPTTIKVQASSTANKIPGLETVNVTSTESFTTCKLYRVHKAGAGTTDDDYTYYADFSTHIDGHVENVRAELSYVTPDINNDGAPFSMQFDLNDAFTTQDLKGLGDGREGKDDNIFLVRQGVNDSKQPSSSFTSSATMVYCDGDVSFNEEVFSSKDIVFLQGAKLKTVNKWSGHFNTGSSNVKNFFFFGSGSEPIAEGDKGNFSAKGFTFYLCGRSNVSSWTDNNGGKVVEIKANGTKSDGTNVFDDKDEQAAFAKKVKTYYSYNTQFRKGGTNEFPTTKTFLTSSGKMKHNALTSEHAPSNPTWSGSLKSFLNSKSFQKNGKNALAPGSYVFTSDSTTHGDDAHDGLDAKFPYVIVLDGGSNYQFWFTANNTYKLNHVVFIINNPKPAYPALFLLEKGAKVYWPGSSNGVVCGNGIFSVEGRQWNDAQGAYDFIENYWKKNLSGVQEFVKKDLDDSGKTRYNSKNEVCAMVIGMGKNHLEFDKNVVVEAFIGLFNEDYGKDKSTLNLRNDDNGEYYCRIMTDGLGDNNDSLGKGIQMPALPQSSALPTPNQPIKKAVTGFSLNSMKYYYGISKPATS